MNLQDYITERGVEAFARDLGVSSHTVRSWRRVAGRRYPREHTAQRIVLATSGRVRMHEIYTDNKG